MKDNKPYPHIEEEDGSVFSAQEPALSTAQLEEIVVPNDVDYAQIDNGVLQVTPEIEEEIAEVERGEVVSFTEFNTMFAKWLD
jgi:hypothetical protein